MTNYSRTTLRELKKRYLNILKKCLLANLMAFSFCLSAGAEIVTDPILNEILDPSSNSELLGGLIDPYTRVIITNPDLSYEIVSENDLLFEGELHKIISAAPGEIYRSIFQNSGDITFNADKITFRGLNTQHVAHERILGGWIQNGGSIDFNGLVIIEENNTSSTYVAEAPGFFNFGNVHFNNGLIVQNNKSEIVPHTRWTWSYTGKTIYNYENGNLVVAKDAYFLNNIGKSTASASNTQVAGVAFHSSGGNAVFKGNAYFMNNKIYSMANPSPLIHGGAGIYIESGSVSFEQDAVFINNTANTLGEVYGGAILSRGYLYFKSNFTFAGNNASSSSSGGKDLFLTPSLRWFNGDSFTYFEGGKGTIGTIEGGIAGHHYYQYEDTEYIHTLFKTGEGLLVLGDNSENHEYEGAFTQTAGTTIANSERFFSHEKAVNTINGGELKTHGAEIAYKATLGGTGTLTHLGTSVDTPTEIKGVTFNGTGLNLTLGTYTKAEQEKEIASVGDRLIEYMDDKGTEVTFDDEFVSYQATDKLFTIKALENDQKAKFILNENLTGMEGNTLTIDNAELDVAEGLKVLGTVVAKDMTLSKGTTPVSFTEVTVAKEGVLDIGTREMNVDSMTLQEGATLKIALNSLQEHGKVNGLITGTATSQLALNLATDAAMGTYQLFDQDNDIALEENLFFNIKDLENGAYEVSKKTTSELVSTFGGETEAKVVTALMEGDSSNDSFTKMQSEMLEVLQSKDKAQVQKAKKALSAVGSKEHPVEQSVASEHLVALQNVVQSEMHGTTVGHSGGDTNPRAKIYIKGLYDRTKSSMGEGFRARSKGAVLGVQSEVTDTLTLGVGYATSQTTAKEDLRRTEVDTNTGFVSAHYQPNAWWVSGLATFSRGEYEEEKQVLSSMGKATYDVDSWGAQVMTGYDIKLENAVITPEVGLRYLSVKQEGYTDTLGTTVSGTQSDYLTALVGVKGTWNMGAIRPTAGVTVGYDVISDDVSALNTLANGASYTVNGEALDRLSTGVSLGVEADLGDRTTLKLEYSGTYRKEYVDHSGMLKLEVKF